MLTILSFSGYLLGAIFPLLLIRIMLMLRTWCGYFSEYFLATNGVKQGVVLSPVLFCVYLDELLVALSEAKVGCYIGDIFVGALAYADDLVLLLHPVLMLMLAICDTYASDYFINFTHTNYHTWNTPSSKTQSLTV